MPRFPSPGSLRVKFPGFIGSIKALRLPAVPLAALRFLRLAIPREHAFFAPAAAACDCVGPGVGRPVSPSGLLPWRRQELPSSWGTPIPVCTCSPTPAGRYVPDRLRNARVAPAKGTTKAPARRLSRLNSMASGLAAYVSRDGYPPDRARLASGCWSSSPGRAFTRRVPTKGFQLTSCGLSSFFQASWHNPPFTAHCPPPTNHCPHIRRRRGRVFPITVSILMYNNALYYIYVRTAGTVA